MNLLSFVDELVKVGAIDCLYKRGADIATSEIPAGMMDTAPTPFAQRLVPDEAGSRLDTTAQPSIVESGMLGSTSGAKKPIDRERFNRPWVERR